MNLSATAAYLRKARLAALGRGVRAAVTAVTFGSTLLFGVAAPASAAGSVQPAYNECPLPVLEPPILRMISALENDVMTMLGIAPPGCNIPNN